jgi:uncharacterized protein (DUF58 family)
MVDIEPARARADDGRVPRGLGRNALVVLLSPLMTSAALQRAVTIANHGTPILVIDCLPTDIAHRDPGEPYAELSWRVELLRRERNIRRAREAGVAVVPWRGPGSLDLVLRDLYRHSSGRTGRCR